MLCVCECGYSLQDQSFPTWSADGFRADSGATPTLTPIPTPPGEAGARRSLWFIEKRGGEVKGMRERERERERAAHHHGNYSPVHNQFVAMVIPKAHLGLR